MRQSFFVSLVAHLLLLAAIALWPGTSLPKRTSTITIQQIQLQPVPEPEVKPEIPPPRVEPQPPPPRKRIPEQRIARYVKERLKERRRTPKPIPTRAPTPARKKKTSTPVQKKATPTPTLDRKVTFVPFAEADSPTKTPIARQDETQAAQEQEVVFEEGFNYQNYTDRLVRKLRHNWDPPAWQPSRKEGIYAVVCFRINANGTVVDVYVERSSGWPDLDDSALRAVRRSSPVEPLPSAYGKPSVRAHVRFWPLPR